MRARLITASLLCLLLTLPASASPERQACASLEKFVQEHFPSIDSRLVHWFFAVDVSRSMGPKVQATSGILKHFLEYMTVPGDKITLITFDDEVRLHPNDHLLTNASELLSPIPLWDVESDKSGLKADLSEPIHIRENRQGTAIDVCRRQMFKTGMFADKSDSERFPILIEIADLDEAEGASEVLPIDKDTDFVGGEGGKSIQTHLQLPISIGGKSVELNVRLSGARTADSRPSHALDRRLPLAEREEVRYPDTYAHIRAAVLWIPLALFALAAIAVAVAVRVPAGYIVNLVQGTRLWLHWPIQGPGVRVMASRNEGAFALPPLRQGLGDPTIMTVRTQPKGGLRWIARFETLGAYQVKTELGLWDRTRDLSDKEIAEVRIRDSGGEVASGRIEWVENRAIRVAWVVTAGLVVMFMLALVVTPMLTNQIPTPRPPTYIEDIPLS